MDPISGFELGTFHSKFSTPTTRSLLRNLKQKILYGRKIKRDEMTLHWSYPSQLGGERRGRHNAASITIQLLSTKPFQKSILPFVFYLNQMKQICKKRPYLRLFWSAFSRIWTEYRHKEYLSIFILNAGKCGRE